MNEFFNELLVELECPICMTYMVPPIRQCVTGHSICDPCKKKLPDCPLCQGQFTDTMNISLEALARKMHYPCINNKTGCDARLTLDERENHERTCSYKMFKCFHLNCSWEGNYEDILNHWLLKKVSNKPYRDMNICHVRIQKYETLYVNIIKAHDELFWYKFKSSGEKLYWTVQFIGPVEKASNYYFEIEIFKSGQPLRRILMSEYCQPVDLDPDDVFKAGTCVITATDSVTHLFKEEQLLLYYMRVKKAENIQNSNGYLLETETNSKKSDKTIIVYSKTFKNTNLVQGGSASLSISSNSFLNTNSGEIDDNERGKTEDNNETNIQQKKEPVKQPRSWYKPPHRARYSKSTPQPQVSTPQHKRKRPVKYTQIKDPEM